MNPEILIDVSSIDCIIIVLEAIHSFVDQRNGWVAINVLLISIAPFLAIRIELTELSVGVGQIAIEDERSV